MKILIVDDIEVNIYLLEHLLKGNGYEVISAANGQEAFGKLGIEKVDMIISDILMPVMDGFQFLREVRGDDQLKAIPFVFYTATYTDEKDEKFALKIGADKFIIKPMDPKEFMGIIKGVFEDARKGKIESRKPAKKEEAETFKLYSERLVKKLEKKMLNLETEIKQREKKEECLRMSENTVRVSGTFLKMALGHTHRNSLFKELVPKIQSFSGCEAVGIRMLDNEGNIPYESYTGFSKSFYESESPLSIKSDKCMCINVIKGDIDQTLPFLTKGGSFYINGTTRFLATVSEEDKGETRNVCNEMGYESVALIPIRSLDHIIGMIHLADSRENKVPLEMVATLEGAAAELGVAIQNVDMASSLERGKKEWEVSFDAISDWVCLIDIENHIVRTNRAAEAFLGMPLEELIGQKCCMVTHGSETPIPGCPFQEMLQTHSRETTEMHLPEADQWLKVTVDPVLNHDGDVVSAVHIVSDITKTKKNEEESLQSKKLESLGILAGGIAHDFNNLLTVILGNIDLAKTCSEPGSEIVRNLTHAKQASLQAKDLAGRFLTFSGGGAPFKEACSLSKTIQGSADSVQLGFGVRVKVSVPGDLWRVDFDEEHIRQVIINLIINANEALPKGGDIRIKAENMKQNKEDEPGPKKGNYVKISIEDEGVGIQKKYLENIFDPYFSTKERGGQRGMGLGLSVCHSIIKKHGGHIEVESEMGVGTTLRFYLPVSD